MSAWDPWDVPVGHEHPLHPGWIRVEASLLSVAFRSPTGRLAEVSIFAVVHPDTDVETELTYLMGIAKKMDEWYEERGL